MILRFRLVTAMVAAAVLVGFAGCTGGSGSCPSVQVQDCVQGAAYLDCSGATDGGAADPVFACTDNGMCQWYEGVCPPAGSHVSPCPANDLCCENDWPFPASDSLLASSQNGSTGGVFRFLSLWGTQPWDEAREASEANVDVVVDSSLSEPSTVDVTCNGVTNTGGLCVPNAAPTVNAQVNQFITTWIIYAPTPDLGTDMLYIKMWPGASSVLICRQLAGDAWKPSCSYLSGDSPVCASSGTLTLSHSPPSEAAGPASVDAEATFPDGSTISAQFSAVVNVVTD